MPHGIPRPQLIQAARDLGPAAGKRREFLGTGLGTGRCIYSSRLPGATGSTGPKPAERGLNGTRSLEWPALGFAGWQVGVMPTGEHG